MCVLGGITVNKSQLQRSLKTQDEAEQQRAQKSLVKTISTLQLLAKQGLPCFTISG